MAEQYIVEFKKMFPGIDVEYFEATQDVLLTRTVAEARAGRVAYDVQDSGQNFPSYKELGLITDNTNIFQAAGADPINIVDGTCNPEWNVYGCSYNTDLYKESDLPRTWAGWLEPKWKGNVAIETRLRPFVYGTPFMGGEEKVTEYLSKLKENNPIHTSGDTKSQTLVAAGEYPVLIGAYLQRVVNMVGKPWGFVPMDEVYSNAPGPGYSVPEKAAHPERRTRVPVLPQLAGGRGAHRQAALQGQSVACRKYGSVEVPRRAQDDREESRRPRSSSSTPSTSASTRPPSACP